MKLSVWAKKSGVCYKTAWTWFKAGAIPGALQMPSGTIIVMDRDNARYQNGVAIYARVSSAENKDNLESQAKRLEAFAAAKGMNVVEVVKEIGSGVNDSRRKLVRLMEKQNWSVLLVEHKDRLSRLGFNYLKLWLESQNRKIEVVNEAANGKDDLVQDFVAVIYSFAAKLYGLRRASRKTEAIIKQIRSS